MCICLGLIIVGGGQILLAVSISGDNRESIEMLPGLGGGVSPLRPAGNEISPSPVGGECGSRRIPSSPALEGLAGHRPWELTPPCWVLSAKLFFFFFVHSMRLCFALSLSRGSPRTRSCNNVPRSTSWWGPCSRASESSLGLSVFVSHYFCALALGSVGT